MFDGPKALVMFSGGKDSFLTACRLAESGRTVVLLSFNNGSLAGETNLAHGATRLMNRYGRDRIEYAGVYSTAGILRRVDRDWTCTAWDDMGREYPGLTNAQANCLHCQSCMWMAAIAYANAKGVHEIAAGYKSSDPFCTGMDGWTDRMSKIAARHEIRVLFPLWETPEWGKYPDVGRDLEMAERLFEPAVLEPKCLIGHPSERPDEGTISSMMRYFDDKIGPQADQAIKDLTNIFKYLKLSERSLVPLKYDTSDGSSGLF